MQRKPEKEPDWVSSNMQMIIQFKKNNNRIYDECRYAHGCSVEKK